MATRMQQRRGTAAQWTAANPILAAGEIGFETDTSKFKMGNGSSAWSALSYFANAAELTALINGAPDLLNTLGELADAIGDDANFVGTVAAHTSGTTNVHGIANTALLATTASVNAAVAIAAGSLSQEATAKADAAEVAAGVLLSAHNTDETNVHGIANTALLATKSYSDAAATAKADAAEVAAGVLLSAHNTDETNVHGIADTSLLATKAYADGAVQAEGTARVAAITTAISALTKSAVGLDQVDNTSDASKPVSTAQGTAISDAVSTHNADETNVHGIADTAELVTQTELTNAISGASVDQSTLAGVGLDWNAETDKFDVESTHITTATQTALDLKAPKASPTFTGTVAGITKSMVGLGNVDNTADSAKPVSTAQATAIATAKSEAIADATSQVNAVLNGAPAAFDTLKEIADYIATDQTAASSVTTALATKAPLNSPTFTGTVTLPAAGIVFSDGTQAKAGVPSITTFGSSFAATGTVAAGEQDKFVPVAGAVTITLPATGYSTGQSIDFYQASGTGAQFASTNSVVGTPGLKFRTTNSVVTAMKTAAGWLVFGDLSA